MLGFEIIFELPVLLADWLFYRLETAVCPECGARLYRVESARKEAVFLCRQCESYWVKNGDRVQPLEK